MSRPAALADESIRATLSLPTPRVHGSSLVVVDLRGKPRLRGDSDQFFHATQQVEGLVSQMGYVDTSVGSSHLREFDDLLGFRVVSRHIQQSGGEAERTVPHALVHERLHRFQFFRGGSPIRQPHHPPSDAGVPREKTDVWGYPEWCHMLVEGMGVAITVVIPWRRSFSARG